MCGIAGVMMRNGQKPDEDRLARMLAAIAHRGPDGHGRWVQGGVALLQARLAIIDLKTGDQPLFAPGGTVLVANGEIYNNPELRAARPNATFHTQSDCEPPAFLYETAGMAFADPLRGMYAIALYDPARRRLVLARDPFGIKPLYYVETSDAFAFASEPQALIAGGFATAAIDPRRQAELLQLKFTTGADTIFPGIKRVLPGETLAIEAGGQWIVERRQRAALPDGGPRGPATTAQLESVLLDSVAVHLRSDVPYGLFLSGGIDSASVLALMHRATGQRIAAITCGWEGGAGVDETAEALRLGALMGADCHRIEMGASDFWSLAPRIAASIDDPTADAAVLPTWLLGRAARAQGLKVTLCGEGADELFGGYSRYRKQRPPLSWLSRKPRSKGTLGAHPALSGWRDGIAAHEQHAAPGRIDIAEWLPNDLLTKLDRCMMAHGVEGRTPFLDPVVADFAFRLPDAQKVGYRFGKLLLRDWLAGAFPQAGAYARKKGFKPPVGIWMQARADELGPLVAAHPAIAACLPAEFVRGCFAQAATEPQRAWSLLFYALWHSHHILGIASDGDIGDVLRAAY